MDSQEHTPEDSRLKEADEASSADLEAAEKLVWRVLREQQPTSLRELRMKLSAEDVPRETRPLLWYTVHRLVNRNELQLTNDRRLHIPSSGQPA
jgi:hypothetical protein